jgi:hypothetical protein
MVGELSQWNVWEQVLTPSEVFSLAHCSQHSPQPGGRRSHQGAHGALLPNAPTPHCEGKGDIRSRDLIYKASQSRTSDWGKINTVTYRNILLDNIIVILFVVVAR